MQNRALPGSNRCAAENSNKIASLKGDEWGYGWNAGILYELDKNNRWGLTYRSEVKIDFDGDYKSGILSPVNGMVGRGHHHSMGYLESNRTGFTVAASARNVGSVRL